MLRGGFHALAIDDVLLLQVVYLVRIHQSQSDLVNKLAGEIREAVALALHQLIERREVLKSWSLLRSYDDGRRGRIRVRVGLRRVNHHRGDVFVLSHNELVVLKIITALQNLL